MKIPLTNSNKFALVDARDFRKVSKFKWRLHKLGYPRKTSNPKVYLHVFLKGNAPVGYECDHKNLNRLDNKRSNLRFVTCSQNIGNTAKRSDNTSGYKGVSITRHGTWSAYIGRNGKRNYLGTFKTREAAAQAYNQAAIFYFGDCARLNEILCDKP